MRSRLPYLPALDGLRAIAVLMVFAYHLEFAWAAGGFLGVDVFFVISGYLITRLLLDEHGDDGRIGLVNFWTRRFKRLVPAMVVMIAATLLATRRWGLAEQWRSVRIDALSAIGYVANWRFVLDQQSYFDASLGPSPLRHTWSLAVEEQWYLLWPIVMIGLLGMCVRLDRRSVGRGRSGRVVVAIVVAAAVSSALLMAFLFDPTDPSRVYFGTDTRAQQLLIGAALAWLLRSAPRIEVAAASTRFRLAFIASLALLVAIAALVPDDAAWLYRGGLLAVSVLAAVVVLGTTAGGAAGTGLSWLGAAPLVWIGRRSYGIYLWHWPVIIFMDPATGGDLGRWPLVGLQIVVTIALAELSHRLIEAPVRRSTAPPARTVVAWSAGAIGVGVAGFVWLVPPASRDLARSDASFPQLAVDSPNAPSPTPSESATPSATGSNGGPAAPSNDDSTEPRRLLLFGDSAAFTLAEQFESPVGSVWDVQAFAEFGCPITPGMTIDAGSSEPNPVDEECIGWVGLWPEYARILEPDVVVVMIGAWVVLDHRVDDVDLRFPSAAWQDTVRTALEEAATAAAASGAPVVFLDVACMGPGPGTTGRADPDRVAAVNDMIRDLAAERDDVSSASLSSVICPDGSPDFTIDGVPARYDGVHYTRAGAALVWPWLLDELDNVVK